VAAFRRFLCLIVLTALFVGLSPAAAQDAAADDAKATLQKGVEQFRAMDFKTAQQTLLTVKRDALAQADQRVLDDYLTRVAAAVRGQQAARDAAEAADKALRAGDFAKAKEGFTVAADSEFLPAAERANARAQLALVDARANLAASGTGAVSGTSAAAASPAAPAPVAAPPPAPAPAATDRAAADAAARAEKARQWVAAGKSALDAGQYALAKSHFQRALDLDPNLTEASTLLAQANDLMSAGEAPGIRTQLVTNLRVAKQEAQIEYDAAMKRSHELAARGSAGGTDADFAAAVDAARLAQNIIDTNRSLFTADEYRSLAARVDDQLAFVARAREAVVAERAQERAKALDQATQERVAQEQAQRQARTDALIRRAKTLQEEKNYRQSLEVIEQILQLDPENRWAIGQVDLLRQIVLLREEGDMQKTKQIETQKQFIDIRESEIPWYEYLRYPRNWKEITLMRESVVAGSSAESPNDRLARQQLRARIPRLQFNDITFENVIQFLRETSGLSIYVNWKALEGVNVMRDAKINILLQDVTNEKALRLILDEASGGTAQLAWTLDDGVIKISTKDDVNRDRPVLVYDIRDLIIRVPNFQAPSVNLTNQNISIGNNTSSITPFQNNTAATSAEGNIPTKDEIIRKVAETITMTVDPENWAQGTLNPTSTGSGGTLRELHGHLVIQNTRETHEKVRQLLAQLREARALQIAIEARFISVTSGFLEDIGLDLDVYFNIGSSLGSTTTTDPWTGATVPTKGGVSGWGPNRPGTNKFTPMGFTQGSATFTSMLNQKTNVPNGIGTVVTADAASISGVFLDDIQVNFLIRATQAHQATKSLTAPRLTLFNGQHANITVGTDQAYVADLTPLITENATTFAPRINVVRSGTVLDVEATVSADRRYVTLTLQPQVSILNGFDKYFTTVTSVDANGTPQTGLGFIQLPNVTAQTVQTTVSIPDGGTLLLGGQKLTGEVEREMGVPLLSKIPVINRAFSNRGMVRDEQTLLILIRPKIIIQSEQERLQVP
jgi:general secretion pathway protein D